MIEIVVVGAQKEALISMDLEGNRLLSMTTMFRGQFRRFYIHDGKRCVIHCPISCDGARPGLLDDISHWMWSCGSAMHTIGAALKFDVIINPSEASDTCANWPHTSTFLLLLIRHAASHKDRSRSRCTSIAQHGMQMDVRAFWNVLSFQVIRQPGHSQCFVPRHLRLLKIRAPLTTI